MVKESRVLAEAEDEADLPYEQTPLARRAAKARPRLAILLLVGAAAFLVEAGMARAGGMALGGAALALVAWGVWRGRLGGIIAAGLAATLGVTVPLALMALGGIALEEKIPLAFLVVWAAILFSDIITLVRDAELQHAYGLWARR